MKQFRITNFKKYWTQDDHNPTETLYIEGDDAMQVSDGHHTMDELYEHRIRLWIELCKAYGLSDHSNSKEVWRTKYHSDGSHYNGWFILGMNIEKGKQITYHLPMKYWDECLFTDLDKAPEYDGHKPSDVLERLKKL